jgi:hypothetical protein
MRDKNDDPDERWLDEFVRLKKAGKVVLDRDEWKAKLEDAYNDGRQSVDAAQTQAYIDGRNDQREEALQIPTGATPMPAGWVPLTLEWEPGYPEDVAFGPKRMMDRLKKWLDKHFARVVADRNAEDGWGAPDARKTWQGGLTNEELEQWWRLKLPNVEAKNRDISVFALGVEVGAGMGSAPKPDAALAVLREGSNPKGECPPGPSAEHEEPGPQDAPNTSSAPPEATQPTKEQTP